MPRYITHVRYELKESDGDVLYLITVENQEVEGLPWKVAIQSASPHLQFVDGFGVNFPSADDALQKATEMLDKRHPGATRIEEDLHIGLKSDGSLSGAPFDVLAAMDQFVETEQPGRARQMIAGDEKLWIVALCGGTKKALAVCDYCVSKLDQAKSE